MSINRPSRIRLLKNIHTPKHLFKKDTVMDLCIENGDTLYVGYIDGSAIGGSGFIPLYKLEEFRDVWEEVI